MILRGHSVFSLKAVDGYRGMYNKGGLSGSFIQGIEELDEKVECYLDGPHGEWVEAYLRMAKRRKGETN